jgi:hypothetical protein
MKNVLVIFFIFPGLFTRFRMNREAVCQHNPATPDEFKKNQNVVVPVLDTGTHVLTDYTAKTWMARSGLAMTVVQGF